MRSKNQKRRFIVYLSVAIALVLAILTLFGCADDKGDGTGTDTNTNTSVGFPDYDGDRLDEYISAGAYTGLDVEIAEGQSRGDAVWAAVERGFEVVEYPDEQVEYYAEQTRARYRYYATRDGVEYETLISGLGVSEESIYAEAREMVKGDLVLLYIIKDAGISLTESERESLFDKYAERFVSIYGYDKTYIAENMKEQVYEAMLYDKTSEYLIVNNTFVAK